MDLDYDLEKIYGAYLLKMKPYGENSGENSEYSLLNKINRKLW